MLYVYVYVEWGLQSSVRTCIGWDAAAVLWGATGPLPHPREHGEETLRGTEEEAITTPGTHHTHRHKYLSNLGYI